MSSNWILASYPLSVACTLVMEIFSRGINRNFGVLPALIPLLVLCLGRWSGCIGADEKLLFSFMELGENSGFPLVFQMDSLRISLLLLLALLSLLIQLYSADYLKEPTHSSYFYVLMSIFQAAMAGLFLAGNLITLFVFWELVGICSYLLVQFYFQKEKVLKAAFQVIMINKAGDVLLLCAIGLLWSYGFSQPLREGFQFPDGADRFLASTAGQWICLFFLLSAMVKSAQLPFSIWLNKAMAGPASVSALLHSATMVAAGVWLMSILAPVFPGNILTLMGISGILSQISGNLAAVLSRNFKSALAFSTLAQLGLMMAAISGGMAGAAQMHLISHAFFKAGLFLLCGWLMKELKEKGIPDEDSDSFNHLAGILRNSAGMRICLGILLAALAGIPLSSGFISKENLLPVPWLQENARAFTWFLYAGMQAGTFLSALYAGRIFLILVFSESSPAPVFPLRVLLPVAILSACSTFLLFGPDPFSSQGWLSAFTGLPGKQLFPDVFASFAGLTFAWLSRKTAFPAPEKNVFFSVISGQAVGKKALGLGTSLLLSAARASRNTDERILNPALEFAARSTVVAGYFSVFTDRRILNGLFRLTGKLFSVPAGIFYSQARHSARYVAWFSVLSLLLLIYFIYYH